MIKTPDIESTVNVINTAQDEDHTAPTAYNVAAQYVICCAVASGRLITMETIEDDLDTLLQHGARFDYSEAFKQLHKPSTYEGFNIWLKSVQT